MATYRDFDGYVLPYVAGAPLPAVDDALLHAAREFCAKTYAVNEENKRVTAPAAETITLTPTDTELEVCAVLDVYGPFGRINPVIKRDLAERFPEGWQAETVDSLDRVFGWLSLGESTVRLVPYLTVAQIQKLRVTFAMRPINAAATLPDLLLARWPEGIAAGALARLHSHENVPYANPNRIASHASVFRSIISAAADEVERGFNRPQLRTGLDVFP